MERSKMMLEYERLTGKPSTRCITDGVHCVGIDTWSAGYVEWLELHKMMDGEPINSESFSCSGNCDNCAKANLCQKEKVNVAKEKVYLRCTGADQKAIDIKGTPDVGVEDLGNCSGHAITESGKVAGIHWSSTLDFLRSDLRRKIDEDQYEIIDLIDQDVADMLKAAAGDKK